jgi:hypothetical protein
VQKFYTAHFNPYVNFHRPCGFATVSKGGLNEPGDSSQETASRGLKPLRLKLADTRYHFQDLRTEALGLSLSYSGNLEQARKRSGSAVA